MNKKQLKDLKAILRSFELNSMVFSNIQQVLEKEQFILEDRQCNYESKGTDYWDDKASDLDERIETITEECEALQDIETALDSLIQIMRGKLSEIETNQYKAEILPMSYEKAKANGQISSQHDPLFEEAAWIVVNSGTASTSYLQRRFSIGYNRAGTIMDQLEAAGIVGVAQGGKPRPVLVDSVGLEGILHSY